MKKIIPNLIFVFLTSFTISSGIPVMAGGCTSHMNKNAIIECTEDDIECQKNKAEKDELGKGSLS